MIIGLTGLIGSGKSEVAETFAKLGAQIISGDELGHETIENNPIVFYRLLTEFGLSICTREGRLNRRRLARLAFSSSAKTKLLNSIVHPALLERLDTAIATARFHKKHAVVDAALLVAWNYQQRMDCTVLVTSLTRHRYQRLQNKGLSPEEIRQRSGAQPTLACMKAKADYIVTNNGDLDSLRDKVQKLYLGLTKRG